LKSRASGLQRSVFLVIIFSKSTQQTTILKTKREMLMNFFKNLFSKDEPNENDMQNYAVSLITPTTLMSHEKYEELLRKKYPKLSIEEIKNLISKSLEIFNACEKILHSDEKFNERVINLYPFLSKKTIHSLHGAVFYSQMK
jgi:hypothetical protein